MKKFNVSYKETIHSDTSVEAETKAEAKRKVQEVLPTARIEAVWEVK